MLRDGCIPPWGIELCHKVHYRLTKSAAGEGVSSPGRWGATGDFFQLLAATVGGGGVRARICAGISIPAITVSGMP
jgi:hypothetical protein